jgi:hypothetical protein
VSTPEPTIEERLKKIQEYEAAKDKERADKELLRGLEYAELKMRFEGELGEEGRDWSILSTVEGFVVVKRVDAIHVKQWDDAVTRFAKEGKGTPVAAMLAFTIPGVVHPEVKTYREWVLGTKERPGADGIAGLAAGAIQRLHGNVEKEVQGKR